MKLLKASNFKLGENIYSFNLPRSTCAPYKTPICDHFCYAKHGGFSMSNTLQHMEENYELARHTGLFEQALYDEIKELLVRMPIVYIRLHPCGDFFSQPYYMVWNWIAKCFPQIHLMAFTRNYEIDFTDHAPNFNIFYSVDPSTIDLNISLNQYSILIPFELHFESPLHMSKVFMANDPALFCNSKCKDCKACWYWKGNICFNQRWQLRGQNTTDMPKYREFRLKFNKRIKEERLENERTEQSQTI
jgi:hypothetical protein